MTSDYDGAEQAIRDYFSFLSDPSSLADKAHADQLRVKAETQSDPLARLRLLSEARRAEQVDGDAVRDRFVKHAARWAKDNGVDALSFRELGVPSAVVKTAFDGVPLADTAQVRTRRVWTDEQWLASIPAGDFTARQWAEATGMTSGATKKRANDLVKSGVLALVRRGEFGPQGGRGPKPALYART